VTQVTDALRDYGKSGNVTLDEALFKLYWDSVITMETALKYSRDPEEIRRLNSETLTGKKSPSGKA
jgi:Tfp pilus assembly pilus retraction ATPase PilT